MTSDTNKLDAFWMPFTANRQFKAQPRMLTAASGMYYTSEDGRSILDGTSGLWCCNAGHGRRGITEAVSRQIDTLDFAPTFQMGHPLPFELAERLVELTPDTLNHVFFTNSGSEAVDTALKIALAWHQLRGQGQRQRLIGREKGYPENAFSRGLPAHGAEMLDELEDMIALHGESTIAAAMAALDIYEDENLFGKSGQIGPLFEDRVHSLANCNNVIDIRNYGMMAAVELAPRESAPLIADESHIEDLISRLGAAINETE